MKDKNVPTKISVARIALTLELVRAMLHYDPLTGVFTWLVDRGPHKCKGRVAGGVARKKNGYGWVGISIDRTIHKAHHLAWFYTHGTWPSMLDHINRDSTDNRIENLRIATHTQNVANRTWNRKSKTTGFRGVSKRKNRFNARISIGGQYKHIGSFKTLEEARAAWCAEASRLRGEFAVDG